MKKITSIILIFAIIANTSINAFAAKGSAWSEEDLNQDLEYIGSEDVTATVPDPTPIVGSDITGTNDAGDNTTESKPAEPPVENTVPDPTPIVGSDITGTNESDKSDDNQSVNNNPVDTDNNVSSSTNTTDDTNAVENKVENKTENTATTNDSSANVTYDKKGEAVFGQATAGAEVVEDDKDASKEESEKDKENKKIQQALKDYAAQLGFTDNRRFGSENSKFTHEYAEQPVIGKDSCSPGKLADTTLKEGLDLINMIRKTAGLGEVTLDDMYNEYAQNGAMVMKGTEGTVINGVDYGGLTHFPPKTDNITADQFKLGSAGTRGGNIGKGHTSLTETILNGYMYDGDAGNILAMGHRRWILNPTMSKVGFGQVGEYNCMYAHDNTNSKERIEDFVTWPATNMPKELMSYNTDTQSLNSELNSTMPWTCQLGNNYKIVPSKNLTITVTYPDGHEFKVPSHKIFCNNQNYGYTNGCITFRADDFNGSNKDFTSFGNNYTVKIDGVLDKNGKATSIEYDVNFFSLFE